MQAGAAQFTAFACSKIKKEITEQTEPNLFSLFPFVSLFPSVP
jgi:hypothetical protein